MRHNLGELDAVSILAAYRDGSLAPAAYAEHIIEAAQQNAHLNALQYFDAEHLTSSVLRAHDEGLDQALSALPLVVKDNINTTNYPTSAGTGALLDHTPSTDAGVVRAIAKVGGVVGAKSGMHELAFGITSNNAVTGAVRNPRNRDLIAGGSSGGTAAAIAAGIFAVGLGTDTGGSCRIPAALCGVVGFRPTTGRYDSRGVVRICHTRDTVGPLARSVRDISLLDQVLSGDAPSTSALELPNVTLGVPRGMFFDDLDPVVASAVEAQIDRFAKAGAKIREVDLSEIWSHNEAFSFPVVFYEVMRDLPMYLAEHAPDISFEMLLQKIGSPDVAGALNSQSGDGAISEAVYRDAINVHRPAMRRIYAQVFEQYQLDAIVFPTTPLTARRIGDDDTVELNGRRMPTFPTYIRNTDLGSNLGTPGISLPCPVDNGALPIGIELDGLPYQDVKLLTIARAVEGLMAAER